MYTNFAPTMVNLKNYLADLDIQLVYFFPSYICIDFFGPNEWLLLRILNVFLM